ncbi:MAG TPA: hypothetical protein VM124_03210 [Candidatus Limnocylindrales bacterium]|nr:hypothetical protein [Candidatus Limnocylindrales bacterium]
MGPNRSIEIVRDNNDLATALCDNLLEPAAEFFAPGGVFASSDLPEIYKVLPDSCDGIKTTLLFTATKVEAPEELDEGEESLLSFRISVRVSHPFTPPMYWPGLTELELAPGDVIVNEARMVELADACPVSKPRGTVHEVWDFYIDNEYYEPRKQRRWEYYDDEDTGLPIAIINAHNEDILADITLSPDDDREAVLREMDIELTEGFSEEDIKVIAGILHNLGYKEGSLSSEADDPQDKLDG